MSEKFRLAGTDITVRIDWDATRVSFGADTSELHCWHCAQPFTADGAYTTTLDLPDGRLTWFDAERYDFPRPDATKSLICKRCADEHDPKAKPIAPVGARKTKAQTADEVFDQIMVIDRQRCSLEHEISVAIDLGARPAADAARAQMKALETKRQKLATKWLALQPA